MKRRLSTLASTLACVAAAAGFSPGPYHGIIASPSSQYSSRQSPSHHGRKSIRLRTGFECAQAPSLDAAATDTTVASDASSSGHSTYYRHLLSQFQGDFDNYDQVVEDRKRGLEAGEGGGHEHIHCTLVPCPQFVGNGPKENEDTQEYQWVLAAFYFNGNPRQIFRFRLYQLIKPPTEDVPVRMKLNTLLPNLEVKLRQCSDKPGVWWREVANVWRAENNNTAQDTGGSIDAAGWNGMKNVGLATMSAPLEGCDVLWDPDWDPSKHAYLYADEYDDSPSAKDTVADADLPRGQSYHATMEAGSKGAVVDSISLIPGKRILIKDELSLWSDEFWINDRGYDPDAVAEDGRDSGDGGMPFVYGNRRGVPYKLRRVSSFSGRSDGSGAELGRTLSDDSGLEWTLGDEYRTPELFDRKMDAIS